MSRLMEKRKLLKQKIKESCDENDREQFEKEIDEIDLEISEQCSNENVKKITEHFGTFASGPGRVNPNGKKY